MINLPLVGYADGVRGPVPAPRPPHRSPALRAVVRRILLLPAGLAAAVAPLPALPSSRRAVGRPRRILRREPLRVGHPARRSAPRAGHPCPRPRGSLGGLPAAPPEFSPLAPSFVWCPLAEASSASCEDCGGILPPPQRVKDHPLMRYPPTGQERCVPSKFRCGQHLHTYVVKRSILMTLGCSRCCSPSTGSPSQERVK